MFRAPWVMLTRSRSSALRAGTLGLERQGQWSQDEVCVCVCVYIVCVCVCAGVQCVCIRVGIERCSSRVVTLSSVASREQPRGKTRRHTHQEKLKNFRPQARQRNTAKVAGSAGDGALEVTEEVLAILEAPPDLTPSELKGFPQSGPSRAIIIRNKIREGHRTT